jgi:alpha-amylase
MNSLSLVFAVHNHQPVGNFESVMEDAYRTSYLPFLQVMDRHPSIAFTQHWTGTLLEWLVRTHPECIERMKEMVGRGQLELLGGGFYEPILAVIPEDDRIGQLHKLSSAIQSVFNYTPRGAWLAERVWEPHLAGSLARAGMEFVVVDDTHFRHAGLKDEKLFGYYITEELGSPLKIFPIDKTLRYIIPFRDVEETLTYLERSATPDGARIAVHADDGEKFGVWPKTFKHVYEDGWLERFCCMIESRSDLVQTRHFGGLMDDHPPQGRIYLPTGTYSEMTRWVLTPEIALQLEAFEGSLRGQPGYEQNAMFVHGGFWRNFFAKYPESNHMHKKMLRVSAKAHEAFPGGSIPPEILEHLWAGQCNDTYWHGLFGGLYLPNLRFSLYRNLLLAESGIDRAGKVKSTCVETVDFDCDGMDEVLIESEVMDVCLKPNAGGSMIELSFKPGAVNLLDILSRREEASHRKLHEAVQSDSTGSTWNELLAKERDLYKQIYFDWYQHSSLLDHFLGEETGLNEFAHCTYGELGDFVNQPYRSTITREREHVRVNLAREGAIWRSGVPHRILVEKKVAVMTETAEVQVDYRLTNLEPIPLDVRFGVEFALGGMAGNAPDRYFSVDGREPADRRLNSNGEEFHVRTFCARDDWMKVDSTWKLGTPATLWRFPLETVSLSETGFERLYQGSVLMPLWHILLKPEGQQGDGWETSIRQSLAHRTS